MSSTARYFSLAYDSAEATKGVALNAYMTYLRYNSAGMVALTTTSGKRYGMSIRLMRDV